MNPRLMIMEGPNAAARDIKAACKKARTSDVNFSFWKEHF